MRVKGITDEDFVNYRAASMFICAESCDFKCDRENGCACCQNSALARSRTVSVDDDRLITRYLQNPITHAIVIGGLEPMDQFWEVYDFIRKLRTDYRCSDTVVIYTGFTEEEVRLKVEALSPLGNIIIKFGRYRPNSESHYDEVLGVNLASPNQYAKEV